METKEALNLDPGVATADILCMDDYGLAILLHEEAHHAPSGHPESSSRLALAVESLPALQLPMQWRGLPEEPATDELLTAVHLPELLVQLKTVAATGGGYVDADTYVTPRSLKAARTVAGAVCAATRQSMTMTLPRSLVIGRPPGHHAESTRAMGFCLVNHIAVAAADVFRRTPTAKVSIVDFDLHHGNGTQEIFYSRADVQYISTHQYPYYPGSGAASEIGCDAGEGYTLNIPLPAGADDRALLEAFDHQIIPALTSFAPDLILVSAGFDGHYADPLGGLRFTPSGFEAVAERLSRASDSLCEGRLVTFVEGGYNPHANRDSLEHYVKGLVSK